MRLRWMRRWFAVLASVNAAGGTLAIERGYVTSGIVALVVCVACLYYAMRE